MAAVTVSKSLIAGTFLTAFGSSMLYGYNIGIFNLPEKHVKTFLLSASSKKNDKEMPNALYSIATSVFIVFGAIGAFCSGIVADLIGRKVGLLVNDAIMIMGSGLFLVSHFTKLPHFIYIGRGVVGLSSGMTLGLASMYLTEIAPVKYRGIIGACHQLAVTFGIALSNLLTFNEVLGSEKLWIIAAALVGVPALIEISCHWMLPESPRYLHRVGKVQEATAAIQKYDPSLPVEDFIREMDGDETGNNQDEPKFKFLQIFTRTFVRPMLIACFIQVMQQLSGINAVMSYSKMMMTGAGVKENVIQYAAFGVSMFNFLITIVSLPLLERFGRRALLLWPTLALAFCLVAMGITVQIATGTKPNATISATAKNASMASVVLIYLYVACFAVGLGTVPGLIVAEVFRQGPRGAAYSVSQGVQWACNLVVTLVYPNVVGKLRGIVFFIFLTFVVIIWVLFFFIMPETKGRNIDEVCKVMDGPIREVFRFNRSGEAAAENRQVAVNEATVESPPAPAYGVIEEGRTDDQPALKKNLTMSQGVEPNA